jgi:hypothetical protein
MFIVCVPIIAWTYWTTHSYAVVQFQIAVLFLGTVAAAAVWYFFGEVIIEGATRIYETLRGQDKRLGQTRPYETYGPLGSEETKYCISCGAEIPRRARFCRECRAEQ